MYLSKDLPRVSVTEQIEFGTRLFFARIFRNLPMIRKNLRSTSLLAMNVLISSSIIDKKKSEEYIKEYRSLVPGGNFLNSKQCKSL